ncbi:SDR family NAD(P)-dependent oxidoreductase [Microbacterium sp.]|uniref:SDR family NAD(P)-dependent oxidoreductase n=1 Tax=Microbacterium sp. TaxID=51671 RepID=UPI003F980822
MQRLTLAGNTTVVTGAASGMGAAIARQLSAEGTSLVLVDRDATALKSLADDLPGPVGTYVVDLRDDDAVFATADEIMTAHPRINALITCAGSSMLGSLDQLTLEEMRWLMDVNLWGTVSITKALLPALRKAPAAHITHLGSLYALAAPAGRIPYSMSKFAVRGFSEALRHELEGTSVTVGIIHPAGVRTGIILHGRYAESIDPAVAARAASAQAAMYHTEPGSAAAQIIRATERRRRRTVIGREARLVDVIVRVAPTRYWRTMRGTLRQATDTTTPAA